MTALNVTERVNRFDFTTLSNRKRTPQGGLVVDANMSRVGVFKYQMADGTVRREFRPQDEVFRPESMDSFSHAPVTDDHPGRVDTSNWKQYAVGYVAGTPARKDRFLSGTLHIQHEDTIRKIEDGKLRELSCGYSCRIDPTAGVTQDGEEYDCIQRDIRGNHVALGPEGWGRAGPEVRLHMDGGVQVEDAPAVVAEAVTEVPVNTDDACYLRAMEDVDRKAVAQAEAKAETAEAALVKVREDSADAVAAVTAELKTLKAELEVLKSQAKQDSDARNSAAAVAAREAEIEATIQVRSDAKKFLGAEWKHDSKTVGAIKREVLAKLIPDYDLKLVEDKAALDAAYVMAVSYANKVDSSVAHTASVVAAASGRSDATAIESEDESGVVSKARKGMEDRKKDAWQTPSRRDRARMRDGRGMKVKDSDKMSGV